MQIIFTVYNCGTGFNRSKNDVIAQLNRETQSVHMINDGPGGGSWKSPVKKLEGLLAGVGVDANVQATVDEIGKFGAVNHMVVNMCGWSRGAVTCFKIANELYRIYGQNVKSNIFAIDPVPGGSAINNHMWQSIELKKEAVGMCNVILSQHDRRSLFSPYFPPVLGPFTDIDLMPGDHSTIVTPKEGKTAAYELVKDMAKRFLMARGTFFKDQTLLTKQDVLEKYAEIAESFDDYAQFASGTKKKFGQRFSGERIIRDVNNERLGIILPVKPAFFINEHHRETYQSLFPNLTNEIDLPPERAFSTSTQSKWMPEFDSMMNVLIGTSKMTLFYICACQKKQGRH